MYSKNVGNEIIGGNHSKKVTLQQNIVKNKYLDNFLFALASWGAQRGNEMRNILPDPIPILR